MNGRRGDVVVGGDGSGLGKYLYNFSLSLSIYIYIFFFLCMYYSIYISTRSLFRTCTIYTLNIKYYTGCSVYVSTRLFTRLNIGHDY